MCGGDGDAGGGGGDGGGDLGGCECGCGWRCVCVFECMGGGVVMEHLYGGIGGGGGRV